MRCLWQITVLWLIAGVTMATELEHPKWQLLDQVGEVEIRYYPPTIEARTTLAHSGQSSAGFKRLAGYIFGNNDQGAKIAMTAPVQESLEQAQPVMAFTLPSEYDLEQLPNPVDEAVQVIPVPARTLAVIGFSGWATNAKIARQRQLLLQALSEADLEATGPVVLQQYNPPWTPPFLRHNELAVELQPKQPDAVAYQRS